MQKVIDLTHPLDSAVPSWTGRCNFSYEIKMDYDQGVRVMAYRFHAGVGTHIDAPAHFIKGGRSVADLRLDELMVPVYVLDVSARCSPDLQITPDDLAAFEKTHGPIPSGSFVIGNTGWSKYWSDPIAFRNPDASGKMHFPAFALKTAELLFERGVVGLGIDTLTPELDPAFPIHHLFLGRDKYLVECLANLHLLPPTGATIHLLPLKITDGAEAPLRAIALLP